MAFSIRLTDEEKQLADSYAKLHAMSVGEAFKQALFEKIEDEYDVTVADEAYQDYLKSGMVRKEHLVQPLFTKRSSARQRQGCGGGVEKAL